MLPNTPMTSQNKSFLHYRYFLLSISVGLNIFLVYALLTHYFEESPRVFTVTESKDKSPENSTILLIWFWPFGYKFDLSSCSAKFHIDGCYLTVDRELYNQAHGVLIHHRDISSDLSNLPTKPRPFFQKWIWMNMESPQNSGRFNGLENLFNVTLNYRRDADIVVHQQIMLKSKDTEDTIFPQVLDKKDKLVCWIVSNWNENYERVKYYYELKKHIEIYAIGRHFGNAVSDAEYTETLTRCKFYLAFENTVGHYDYITEKLYFPLSLGSVPVTLGPPRHIYEKFVPNNAFIHVNDFSSPQNLAQHLLSLDKNLEEYKKYFQWRQHFEVKLVSFPDEQACRACQYIRTNKQYQFFENLNKWYWNPISDET